METKKLMLVMFVLASNFTFSQQPQPEEIGFWNQPIIGIQMYELVVTIVTVILIIFFAYFTSLKKKNKRR